MPKAKAELDQFDQAAKAIRRSMPRLTATILSRFKKELPEAGADLKNVEDLTLSDHSSTLIAEVATILNGMKSNTTRNADTERERERQREMVLSDGRTIYSVLGELHGRQRRNLKWTERAVRLEYSILTTELRAAAAKGSISGEDEREVSDAISRILTESRDHALKTFCTPAKVSR
jgi:hypothetical protein